MVNTKKLPGKFKLLHFLIDNLASDKFFRTKVLIGKEDLYYAKEFKFRYLVCTRLISDVHINHLTRFGKRKNEVFRID